MISVQDTESVRDDDIGCRAVVSVIDRIGDKWVMMVLGNLRGGPMRFNAILRSIEGISHRMLTHTLRTLECEGLVKRIAYGTIPPRVDYELTELGRSLIAPLAVLTAWVRQNHPAIQRARTAFEARE